MWPSSCAGNGNRSRCACSNIASHHVPSDVTTIPHGAFWGCKSLKTISGMEGVTEVGEGTFGRSGLASFAWPSKATRVPRYAFHGCKSINFKTVSKNL